MPNQFFAKFLIIIFTLGLLSKFEVSAIPKIKSPVSCLSKCYLLTLMMYSYTPVSCQAPAVTVADEGNRQRTLAGISLEGQYGSLSEFVVYLEETLGITSVEDKDDLQQFGLEFINVVTRSDSENVCEAIGAREFDEWCKETYGKNRYSNHERILVEQTVRSYEPGSGICLWSGAGFCLT